MTNEERTIVGRKLAAIRVEKKLDQRQAAKLKSVKLGVGTVQAIENNWYEVKERNIDKLAAGLGASLEKLLREIRRDTTLEPDNPLLEGLNEEHLEIARWYMKARKRTRELVDAVVARGDDQQLINTLLKVENLPVDALPLLETWIGTMTEPGKVPASSQQSKNTKHTGTK